MSNSTGKRKTAGFVCVVLKKKAFSVHAARILYMYQILHRALYIHKRKHKICKSVWNVGGIKCVWNKLTLKSEITVRLIHAGYYITLNTEHVKPNSTNFLLLNLLKWFKWKKVLQKKCHNPYIPMTQIYYELKFERPELPILNSLVTFAGLKLTAHYNAEGFLKLWIGKPKILGHCHWMKIRVLRRVNKIYPLLTGEISAPMLAIHQLTVDIL